MGGDPHAETLVAQRLDLTEVIGDRRLAHARQAAARVGGEEQHELDARLGRRVGGGARLLEAQVVELADRRVAGRAHLARTRRRTCVRTCPGDCPSASRSMPSRHSQKSEPAARPRSARWNVCVCALTNPGSVSVSATA